MASSSAATVVQYLAELPAERRSVVARLRDLVRDNVPAGYEEGMDFGMIVWSIPLARFPETYNGHPLGYVALAAQKHFYALYLSTYMTEGQMAAFARAFEDAGKRMDMGKSCLRFKAVEDLPLDVVAREIARTPPDELIALYERSRAAPARGGATRPSKGAAKAKSPAGAKVAAKVPVKKAAAKIVSKAVSKTSAPRARPSARS